MAEKFGALKSLNRGDFDRLSLGVQGQNRGTDLFGLYNFTPSNALTTGLGMVTGMGTPMAVGSIIGNYQAEEAANKLLGNPTNFMNNVKQPSNPNSAVSNVISRADANKDRIVTNFEMNKFGQQIPGLDLAPMYIGGNENKMVKGAGGKTMPSGAKANPYSSRDLTQIMSTPESRYVSQDYIDDNLKTTKDYAADAINQTNIKNYDPTKGTYDKNFAKAVTKENQGGGGGGSPTYICTALYEMGDMKKYIYKYDQVYGKRVDPNVYRGYCVWGEYVATKMRDKGIVYKIAKPLALGWAKQMAFDLSKGRYGKNNKFVKVKKGVKYG
mgnify:CR=1 FL=1